MKLLKMVRSTFLEIFGPQSVEWVSHQLCRGRSVFGVDLQAAEGKVLEGRVHKLGHWRRSSSLTNLTRKNENYHY